MYFIRPSKRVELFCFLGAGSWKTGGALHQLNAFRWRYFPPVVTAHDSVSQGPAAGRRCTAACPLLRHGLPFLDTCRLLLLYLCDWRL